jgi:hypothetical protein
MPQVKKPLTLESFAAGKMKSVLIGQPENLEVICSLLNGEEPQELCSELRKLVETWQKSGPNLAKMLKDDAVLGVRVRHGRTLLAATSTGKGHLVWLPTPRDVNAHSWKGLALAHFMDLIVNPKWHKLGGPCQRCHKYYVKKTCRQKMYCSRRCGSSMTALATTRKKRIEVRVQKVIRAQAAANQWATVRTRRRWKEWVSIQTMITVKWLTRAVNKGDLRAPVNDSPIPAQESALAQNP